MNEWVSVMRNGSKKINIIILEKQTKMPKSSIYGCGIKSSSLHFIDTYGLIATVCPRSISFSCIPVAAAAAWSHTHSRKKNQKSNRDTEQANTRQRMVCVCYFTIRKINAPKSTRLIRFVHVHFPYKLNIGTFTATTFYISSHNTHRCLLPITSKARFVQTVLRFFTSLHSFVLVWLFFLLQYIGECLVFLVADVVRVLLLLLLIFFYFVFRVVPFFNVSSSITFAQRLTSIRYLTDT